jgi:hypothetical protein
MRKCYTDIAVVRQHKTMNSTELRESLSYVLTQKKYAINKKLNQHYTVNLSFFVCISLSLSLFIPFPFLAFCSLHLLSPPPAVNQFKINPQLHCELQPADPPLYVEWAILGLRNSQLRTKLSFIDFNLHTCSL